MSLTTHPTHTPSSSQHSHPQKKNSQISLPKAAPPIQKTLQHLHALIHSKSSFLNEARDEQRVVPDFLSMVQLLQSLQKHLDDEAHLDIVMPYWHSIFMEILLKGGQVDADSADPTSPQWHIVKSFCISFLGHLFEISELHDNEALLEKKKRYLRDLVVKEGFLEVLGRMMPEELDSVGQEDDDHPNTFAALPTALNAFYEDRKLLFGCLKLWNAMVQLLGVDVLMRYLLKERMTVTSTARRKSSGQFAQPGLAPRKSLAATTPPVFTYAYRILLFLHETTYAIWNHSPDGVSSSISDLERADIFMYTSELFDTLTQESPALKALFPQQPHFMQLFFKLLHLFIERPKPKVANELEGFSHVMDALASSLTLPANQQYFCRAATNGDDGVSLLMKLIKKHKYAREAGIRALLYALIDNPTALTHFVHEQHGLKLLFALFMKPLSTKGTENLIELLVQVVNLSGASIHMRFIQKFKEKSYAKTDRLVSIFLEYHTQLEQFENEIKTGKYVEMLIEVENIRDEALLEERILADRLKNGLYVLRLIAKVIAYVCEADVRNRVQMHLKPRQLTLENVAEVLEEYVDFLPEQGDEVEEYRCGILIKFLKGEAVETVEGE